MATGSSANVFRVPACPGHASAAALLMSCPPLNLGRTGIAFISPSLPICLLIYVFSLFLACKNK